MNIDEKLEASIENKYMKNDKGKNKMELTIEESVYILKRKDFNMYVENRAIETLLTAYEKEKEKNKELENDLKDMTKRYMEAESVKFWYNYIHKDKIRKMLQELEDRRNKQPVIGYWSKKAMLEKLLKEE